MTSCLDFKEASCKDCYKCLRNCPVKAIAVINHQARIIEDRCILCGTCMHICPQNAKNVHSEIDKVKRMLSGNAKVIVSVAPSFISSFGIDNFSLMKIALGKLGFADAEETAVGANLVVNKYRELLEGGTYKNFITSACPAVNRLIRLYYPKALPYLAAVDTPMIAHAKMLRKQFKNAKIVFVGPCIAKKREAEESGLVDAVLTFEELKQMFNEKNIVFEDIAKLDIANEHLQINKAKYFPISRGIIKSISNWPASYEYVAVDGVSKCMEILENIDSLSGMFLELNACDYACVNGPCSLTKKGAAIKANEDIRRYVNKDMAKVLGNEILQPIDVKIDTEYPRLKNGSDPISERQICEILAKTGKNKPEDELNCGACGYSTCREKAWAVANGYAELEMCLPYMRARAETMSYEIIKNSPNGIIVLDNDLKILDMNSTAVALLGVDTLNFKGRNYVDFANPTDFILAQNNHKNLTRKKVLLEKTKKYVDVTINSLNAQNVMFAILIDVTDEVGYDGKLAKVRLDTIATTDEVIKKQMRVAQEIASLLGETTAETKVALLKLKKVLSEADKDGE
ncbi:MAG: [Fe-Fe] hydrogenase large subunit C-terminal domain-containing protein [Clostridia bacterium]